MLPFSGTWQSSVYPYAFSHGNVWVELPEDLLSSISDTDTTQVQAKIVYKGLYRLNQEEVLQVNFRGKNSEVCQYHTPETVVQDQKIGGDGKLVFTIQEVIRTSNTVNQVKGNFALTHPQDHGTFELTLGSNHAKTCVIS